MANGTVAASQIEMLSQSGTGITTIVPPATNTNRTLTLPDSTGTVATLGTSLTLATAVTASGTSVDFTGIPSWAKRVTVVFAGLSSNAATDNLIRLGTSGGVEATGYLSASAVAGFTGTSFTNGFGMVVGGSGAATVQSATYVFSLLNPATNLWVGSLCGGLDSPTGYSLTGGGQKTLAGVLNSIRITTVNGTATFDAGSINIMYEG